MSFNPPRLIPYIMPTEFTNGFAILEELLEDSVAQRLLLDGGVVLKCEKCGFFVCTGCKNAFIDSLSCHQIKCYQAATKVENYETSS